MRRALHPDHISNLSRYTRQERTDYFVRDSVEFESVWGLSIKDGNWITFKGDNGNTVFPVWSHFDLASAFMFEEHRIMQSYPAEIKLDVFLADVIPDMRENETAFGVFPVDRGFLEVPPQTLLKAMQDQILEMETF